MTDATITKKLFHRTAYSKVAKKSSPAPSHSGDHFVKSLPTEPNLKENKSLFQRLKKSVTAAVPTALVTGAITAAVSSPLGMVVGGIAATVGVAEAVGHGVAAALTDCQESRKNHLSKAANGLKLAALGSVLALVVAGGTLTGANAGIAPLVHGLGIGALIGIGHGGAVFKDPDFKLFKKNPIGDKGKSQPSN